MSVSGTYIDFFPQRQTDTFLRSNEIAIGRTQMPPTPQPCAKNEKKNILDFTDPFGWQFVMLAL
jgi:hypothetical protein